MRWGDATRDVRTAILRALEAALIEGALAGLVAGAIDATVVVRRAVMPASAMPLTVGVVVGLAVLAGVVIGAPLIIVARGLGRHPLLVGLRRRLAAPGPTRVAALVDVVGGAVAVFGFALAVAATVLAVGARFRAPGAVAALSAAIVVALGLALALLATAVLPPLGRALASRAWARRLTTGRAGAIVVAVVGLVLLLALQRAPARVAPAWDAGPTEVLALAVVIALALAAIGGAARLGRPRALAVLALALVLAGLGLGVVGRAATARGAIAEHGVISGGVLRGLWRLTDGDGDGFGDGFGAADCDDHDARVHPHAIDLAGDGVDGNCAGGDPDPVSLAAARAARPSAAPGAIHHDVVLVTIDSLRADHTGLAGYPWPTTPSLDALAARAASFDRARSPAPLTRRAVPALLYGRMAATLPFSASRRWPLLQDSALPTLATAFAAGGYRTAAIVSHWRLPLSDATYRGFAEVIGLSDELVSRHHDNADVVIDRALAWLATPSDRPRFLWVHLIDPHYPYAPPAGAPRLGAGRRAAYDREIAFADAQLGRLLAALSADRTIIAVTADHGEAFGEHHTRCHGHGLGDEETRVPLVIAAPGGPAARSSVPVTLIELAPTLLDLVGLETPAGMTGVSLAATVRTGAPPPARPVLTELFDDDAGGRELIAVHVGDHKLIRDLAAGTVVAYDLAADPGERAPLTDAVTIAALTRALAQAQDREQASLAAP